MKRYIIASGLLYGVAIGAWALGRRFYTDEHQLIFLLNIIALYLFIPLPLLLITAAALRSHLLWAVSLGLLLIFWAHFSPIRMPKSAVAQSQAAFSIMTYNMELTHFPEKERLVKDAILAAGADIVAIQELNYEACRMIQQELISQYPYQWLMPAKGAKGMGIISRFPLEKSRLKLPGSWFRAIQIAEALIHDRTITLVNVHFNRYYPGSSFRSFIQKHLQHAAFVSEFAHNRTAPLILLGDFNSTPTNTAYQLVRANFKDAWSESGFGFGHTFPGIAKAPEMRVFIKGVPLPEWIIRIDHIFMSTELITHKVHLGPFNEESDHRPVIAHLGLTD